MEKMKMRKKNDNTPAINALKAIGYPSLYRLDEPEDSFRLRTPEGNKCNVKIHKSRTDGGGRHRHRFGITFSAFDKVDSIVLYADNERYIFVVPSNYLSRIFESERQNSQVRGWQWVVNVYFDDDKRGFEFRISRPAENYSLEEYRSRIPD